MATAIAHPNIALVKYWGKRDIRLNLPSTSSLSLTLAPFRTRTTVHWDRAEDRVEIDGRHVTGEAAARVTEHIDRLSPSRPFVHVYSTSNFPAAAGLASSASAFAALTVAACAADGQTRTPEDLSRLARRGSGSACRSLWGGFVEWPKGESDDGMDSHGRALADRLHWDLRMVVAIFDSGPKKIGSRAGMLHTMATSSMYDSWVTHSDDDFVRARRAVFDRDLEALGVVMERSATRMHASMLASAPPVRYWVPSSVWAMDAVEDLRRRGIGAWWTMDAGPNVKILCLPDDAEKVAARMRSRAERVEILEVGGAPCLIDDPVLPTKGS